MVGLIHRQNLIDWIGCSYSNQNLHWNRWNVQVRYGWCPYKIGTRVCVSILSGCGGYPNSKQNWRHSKQFSMVVMEGCCWRIVVWILVRRHPCWWQIRRLEYRHQILVSPRLEIRFGHVICGLLFDAYTEYQIDGHTIWIRVSNW